MLFAASVRQQSTRVTRGLFALLAAGLLSVFSIPIPVFATGTGITVGVHDGLPASLTIITDLDGKTVTQPTVMVEGVVHNVTQVVVYVDGIYNTSLPLPSGSGTYTIAFGVAPGEHEVRVTGLDAYSGTEASQTFRFSYAPVTDGGSTTTDSSGNTIDPSPVNSYINDTIDAAKATQASAAEQVRQASSSGPLGDLGDIAFNAFKSVDMVSSTDGTGINKMAGRFTLVSAGLAASVFPWSAYSLVQKIRFIPKFSMSSGLATASMRAVGIALMVVPFLFM